MSRRVLLLPLLCLATACPQPRAAPHPRALENNEYCAQSINDGKLDKAETYCNLGLEFSPDYAELWNNKAIIADKRGQKSVAKELYIKAIRLNQELAQSYNNLGVIYLEEDKAYGKAHDMFQRALKVNPDYLEARYNLGLTYQRMGDKTKARQEYSTILAVSPDIADVHENLGLMAFEDHKLEEATAELQKAVELEPRFADAWLHLGLAFGESGKYKEALEAFTSCLSADPDNAACRKNATLFNRKAQLLDTVLKDAESEKAGDNTAPSYYAQAKQFRDRNLKDQEERAYRRCLKVDSKYAPCHWGLYLLFREDRRDKEATIACKNFLKFAVADEFPQEVETCEKYVSASSY